MARRIIAIVLLAGMAFCGVLVVAYESDVRQARLESVPAGLGVTSVLYAREENWGSPFLALPGDNETGIIVYELPPAAARAIEAGGAAYLASLSQAARAGTWRGHFPSWHPTPLTDPAWMRDPATNAPAAKPSLIAYLGKYGFGIEVDSAIVSLIDDAIARPGSYFANGRIGVLIVMPGARRAAFVYAG